MDRGATYNQSPSQKALYRAWLEFWEIIDRERTARNADLWVVLTGDALDLNKHDGLDPVCHKRSNIVALAADVYGPIKERASRLYVVKGTEAHVGPHCELEELLATKLGAVPDKWENCPAHWWLPLKCEGVLFDIAHHPTTVGHKEWTKGAAPSRMSAELALQYHERGERVPDVALRGHVHYFADSGEGRKPRVFYLDPWSLTTAFGHRRGAGGMTRPVGGSWYLCDGGKYEFHREWWQPQRRTVWRRTT
ncbi:MAG: hypothetical protein KKB67_13435 [Alphaproteobacteria bacterium]|nr:hypothetical protein [Alphaproteobacteria bacterium]